MLPLQAIKEYRKLVKKHYGVDLPLQKTTKEANKLINLIKVIEGKKAMENGYEPSTNS